MVEVFTVDYFEFCSIYFSFHISILNSVTSA